MTREESGLVGEVEPREFTEPLRQGDIFRWKEATDPWQRYGIIITADCDLVFAKHRGALSYCPVLQLDEFLTLFWLKDEIGVRLDRHLEQLSHEIATLQSRYLPQFSRPVQQELLIEWLDRRGAEGLITDLGVSHSKDKTKLKKSLAVLSDLRKAATDGSIEVMTKAIASAKAGAAASGSDVSAAAKRLWRDLAGKAKRPPGDLFFISSLGPDMAGGFMVYLRQIRSIRESEIAVTPIQERLDPAIRAVRLARLRPEYRYAMTQRFAAVFASIGLPVAYEESCGRAVDELSSQLSWANPGRE